MRAVFAPRNCCQDTDEAAYYEIDRNRPLSFQEIKSDLVLSTARAFTTITPIRNIPRRNARRCVKSWRRKSGRTNPDGVRAPAKHALEGRAERSGSTRTTRTFVGHSYGCHDNYLMRRDVPWESIVAGMLPFLITRQIFAGAGKIGIEAESATNQLGVISDCAARRFFQRAGEHRHDETPSAGEHPRRTARRTQQLSPISRHHRRPNMSQFATAMKIGTTALVLELIERGNAPEARNRPADQGHETDQPRPASPMDHPAAGWPQDFRDRYSAALLKAAPEGEQESDQETNWLLSEWEIVLDDLDRDLALRPPTAWT